MVSNESWDSCAEHNLGRIVGDRNNRPSGLLRNRFRNEHRLNYLGLTFASGLWASHVLFADGNVRCLCAAVPAFSFRAFWLSLLLYGRLAAAARRARGRIRRFAAENGNRHVDAEVGEIIKNG
jgi:hypothetical protein